MKAIHIQHCSTCHIYYQCANHILCCLNESDLFLLQNLDSDRHLTQKQRSEQVALDALLVDKLRPALVGY